MLSCQQLIDIGCLMLAQRLGHGPETPGQQVHLCRRGQRQHQVKIAFADVVGSLGQCFDGRAKAAGNAMGGHKADYQHRQPDQPQQGGNDDGAITGSRLRGVDVIERLAVLFDQTIAQRVEAVREFLVTADVQRIGMGFFKGFQKKLVVLAGLSKTIVQFVFALMLHPFIEQGQILVRRRFQRLGIGVVAQHQDQLVTQGLTQLEAQIKGDEVVADQRFLRFGHLHHADHAQQQAKQRHRYQCRNAQEQPGPQLDRKFHQIWLTGCIACACDRASRRQSPGFLPLGPGCHWSPAPHRCALFLTDRDSRLRQYAAYLARFVRPCPSG